MSQEAEMWMRALGAVTVATLVVTGCGVKSSTGPAGPPAGPSAGCVTPKLAGSSKTFTLTEQDNGKKYCVIAGTSMFVFLHSSPLRLWTPITASSAVLQPRPSGVMSLARGVTGAYFLASGPGQAVLESGRTACHLMADPSTAIACRGPLTFRVTIVVRGQA